MNQIPNIEEVEQKLVKHLVDRFLGWRLPKDFHPDGGIMFMDVYENGTEQGGKFEPVGTNLFTAEQAKEMFRFLLEHEDGTPILTELFHHQLQKAQEVWFKKGYEDAESVHKDELQKAREEERERLKHTLLVAHDLQLLEGNSDTVADHNSAVSSLQALTQPTNHK